MGAYDIEPEVEGNRKYFISQNMTYPTIVTLKDFWELRTQHYSGIKYWSKQSAIKDIQEEKKKVTPLFWIIPEDGYKRGKISRKYINRSSGKRQQREFIYETAKQIVSATKGIAKLLKKVMLWKNN